MHNSSSWNKYEEASIQAHKKNKKTLLLKELFIIRKIYIYLLKNKKSKTFLRDDALGVEGAKNYERENYST